MVSNLRQVLNVNVRYVLKVSANSALQSARTKGRAVKLSNQSGKFQGNIRNEHRDWNNGDKCPLGPLS